MSDTPEILQNSQDLVARDSRDRAENNFEDQVASAKPNGGREPVIAPPLVPDEDDTDGDEQRIDHITAQLEDAEQQRITDYDDTVPDDGPKPTVITPIFDNFPAELTALPNWVMWLYIN